MSERNCAGCGVHLGSAWRGDLCVICIAMLGRRVDKCCACGESVSLAHEPGAVRAHRCVDCDAVFCRACIREHFASSARAEEIDTLRTRLAAAEAEVARLRGELDRLRVTTADIETMRQMTEDVRAIGARSEALAREAALREAAGVCRSQVWGGDDPPSLDEYRRGQRCGAMDCVKMIERLLDAAPAAEVSDG